MYHKATDNHKDSVSRKQCQINLGIVELQPILAETKDTQQNVCPKLLQVKKMQTHWV